ncbi:MAG: transposase [bacterium]|nr:transposase [bacterium]
MLRRHNSIAIPGTLHFVTTVTAIRGNWFTGDEVCRQVLWEFEKSRIRQGLQCLGYVLMPDHVHAVLFQLEEGLQISAMLRDFKAATALSCRPEQFHGPSLWQRRYDDVPLPGINALFRRLEYMHNNPVKRGFATSAGEWPWSSVHDFLGASSGVVRVATELVPTAPVSSR